MDYSLLVGICDYTKYQKDSQSHKESEQHEALLKARDAERAASVVLEQTDSIISSTLQSAAAIPNELNIGPFPPYPTVCPQKQVFTCT